MTKEKNLAYIPMTQLIEYVLFIVSRFQEILLRIIQYKHSSLNILRRITCCNIWSSAQHYAVLDLLLNMIDSFISAWPKLSCGNNLYQLGSIFTIGTRSQRANWWSWPFNIFTWCIGSGNCICVQNPVIETDRGRSSEFWDTNQHKREHKF